MDMSSEILTDDERGCHLHAHKLQLEGDLSRLITNESDQFLMEHFVAN
jgi:hypothetical protein